MLDYPALAALAAVHRSGSFEAAARHLGVTPSAVSQRLRGLEDRHGAALILRGQPARATAEGLRLIRHLERVELLETRLGLRDSARVRIAINADSLATWALPALAACAGMLFQVVIHDQDDAQTLLRGGEVAGAITSSPTPPQGYDSRPLGRMRYVATAAPDFIARHLPGLTASHFARAPGLRSSGKDTLQRDWLAGLVGQPADFPEHEIASPEAFVAACLSGMAWALNPLPLVAGHIAAGRLVALVPDRPLDVPLHWQYARASAASLVPLTRALRKAAGTLLAPGEG